MLCNVMPWIRGFELNEKRCVGYVCYFKMFVGWEADVYGIASPC